jgi:hypothetical protein
MFGRLLAGHMYAFELRALSRSRPHVTMVAILSRPTKTKGKWSFVAKAQEVSRGFVAWSHTG